MKYADFEFVRHQGEALPAATAEDLPLELDPPTLPAALDFSVPATVAARIDVRGLAQPLPLLMTRRAIAGLAVGQVLEVHCDAETDFSSWRAYERVGGHRLAVERGAQGDLLLRFRRS